MDDPDLVFRYQRSLDVNRVRHTPKVRLTFEGPTGIRLPGRYATADTGAAFTTLDKRFAAKLGCGLQQKAGTLTTASKHSVDYWLAPVLIRLEDERRVVAIWTAEVAFTEPVPINRRRYASTLFGRHQGLEYFDAHFEGANRVLKLKRNAFYPGVLQPDPPP